MTLAKYFPLSVVLLAGVIALTVYLGVPPAPFVLVLLAAETLIGFQLEDHRVSKFLKSVFRPPTHHAH